MPRLSVLRIPNDPSLYHAVHMHPRAAVRLAFHGFPDWLRQYLVNYPTLTHEMRIAFSVVGMQVAYADRCLFDSVFVDINSGVRVRQDGGLVMLHSSLEMNGRSTVRVSVIMRPVLIGEETALSATPGAIPEELLRKFQEDEIEPATPPRIVPTLVEQIQSSAAVLAQGNEPFMIHRNLCEIADQWCFIDVPDIAQAARESFIVSKAAEVPALRRGLGGLAKIDVELRRPYTFLDAGTMSTTAYLWNGRAVFVHQLQGRPAGEVRGTIVEQFA